MTPLRTHPADITRWLGVAPLHNSESLKPMKDDSRAEDLRRWWWEEQLKMQASMNDGGPPDAA